MGAPRAGSVRLVKRYGYALAIVLSRGTSAQRPLARGPGSHLIDQRSQAQQKIGRQPALFVGQAGVELALPGA